MSKKIENPRTKSDDLEKKTKTKKRIKWFASLVVIVIVAIIVGNNVLGSWGYKGAVRKIMNAYEECDANTFDDILSGFYAGESSIAGDFCDDIACELEEFEEQVGEKYNIIYKITNSYEISEDKYEELLDAELYDDLYDNGFDADIISKAMEVEVHVSAVADGGIDTKKLTLMLTKEKGDWKLFDMKSY